MGDGERRIRHEDSSSFRRSQSLEKVESATQLNTVIREMQSQWDDVVKNSLVVGDYVNVVEVKKTKTVKTKGWVKKVNKSKALVEMRGGSYRVPFSMIEKLNK